MPDPAPAAPLPFGGVTPVLRVNDGAASRDYYVQALGFKINFETEDFVSVSRGRCCLFLCEGDQGHPGAWVWIDGQDVDALYAEYQSSEQRSATRRRTTHGPWRCRWNTKAIQAPGLHYRRFGGPIRF